ncbi:MAG: ATP-dependent DNA helicase RecG [Dehalococcoidia bacterium]|nr:MAG: ATP-dependent DNA helicase RecG [Dehalococcoidia bacterium]
MTADLPRLRGVLQRELDAGAYDFTVPGGLDTVLREQARGEPPGSAVLRMIGALPSSGFGSLTVEERAAWLRRALATVKRELTLEDALTPVTRGTTRMSAAPRTATKKPARAKAPLPDGEAPTTRPRAAAKEKIAPGAAGLDLPIEQAGTGLGPAHLGRLKRMGIHVVRDALQHYPSRHTDFSQTVAIAALRVDQEQTVRGRVVSSREVRMGRGGKMRSTEVVVQDEGGSRITATFFNQPFMARALPEGAEIALAGKVARFRNRPQYSNPEWERLEVDGEGKHTGRLVPVYPLTEGLPQRTMRTAIAKLLERYGDRIEDPLPAEIRKRLGLLGLMEATRQCHYPDSHEALREARRRLAFDELLAIQVGVQTRRREWRSGDAPAIEVHSVADDFLRTLPWALTKAQARVLNDVREDIAQPHAMSRLLEGDVGSGKTVVALAAMLSMVQAGYQSVLMAPTEVLAEQHYRTLCRLLSGEPEPPLHGLVTVAGLPLQVRVVLLTGSTRAAERKDALNAIRFGGAQIVVGTHALIQEGVTYHRLGLAVVDEQHRFGVMQRGELRRKGIEASGAEGRPLTPHLLVMSATPIPRTLALTAYGDLDLSIIDEMPAGRVPIETRFLPPIQRVEAFQHIRKEVAAGRQAFVICPLVEGSEVIESRAATEEYERLRTEQFPELAERILLLHGRMPAREKDRVMRAFAAHEADILVSTAVVEVGIDVPNATVMVIEGADRFGLAQLHQFRGRVGRGEYPSHCFLLADDPSAEAEDRLSVMERTSDGFALAEADLQLRGPGDLFGTAQSGVAGLRVASLLDAPLIDAARKEASALLEADPELALPEHRALRYAIASRTGEVVVETH